METRLGNFSTPKQTKKKEVVVVEEKRPPRKKREKQKKQAKPVKVIELDVNKPMNDAELNAQRAAIRARGKGSSGVGATIGNLIYPGLGGLVGSAAEGLFKTILGKGDYTEVENINSPLPKNNTIMGLQTPRVAEQVMQMHSDGLCTRVQHREFFASVNMYSTFTASGNLVFPWDSLMFPWLRGICPFWQKYKFHGMVIEYVPTSTNAVSAGSPATGSVMMSFQYDMYAPTPISGVNLLNTQGAVSGRPMDQIVLAVECDDAYTPVQPLYINTGASTGPDARLYVFGKFVFATQGPAAWTNIGQLWVTYDVTLISPWIETFALEPRTLPSVLNDSKVDDEDEVVVPKQARLEVPKALLGARR